MKMHEIFGDQLLPMMEYVGWLKTNEGILFLENIGLDGTHSQVHYNVIGEAHRILDQKMDIGWFVRPAKPELPDMRNWAEHYEDMFPGQQSQIDQYEEDLDKHEKWTCMFEGEWEVRGDYLLKDGEIVVDMFNFKRMNLNSFATHCINNGIELIINKEYELNENYEV